MHCINVYIVAAEGRFTFPRTHVTTIVNELGFLDMWEHIPPLYVGPDVWVWSRSAGARGLALVPLAVRKLTFPSCGSTFLCILGQKYSF